MLTLVRGREAALANLLDGLARQTRPPDEIIVACMQPAPPAILAAHRLARPVQVPGERLPLARARNRAAEASRSDLLVLLDVDCIPSAGLVARYAECARLRTGVLLGEVGWLGAGALSGCPRDAAGADAHLAARALAHPSRPRLASDEIRPEPDGGMLWGLNFAVPAATWRAVGGMDERYEGYGGEETDFAARLCTSGVAFAWIGGATAWHQHHPVQVPPLQHFEDIVRHAELFFSTWRRWPMGYWLDQFEAMGLIAREDGAIRVRRRPDAAELDASRRPGDVRFS